MVGNILSFYKRAPEPIQPILQKRPATAKRMPSSLVLLLEPLLHCQLTISPRLLLGLVLRFALPDHAELSIVIGLAVDALPFFLLLLLEIAIASQLAAILSNVAI